jgi:hypothetical protein
MDRPALERLGHHVVSRRVALGYRNRTDLASSLQFTVRTLADIEHGVRKASPGTYAMLENKLSWAPGSIDTILADGDPKETMGERSRTTSAPLSHTNKVAAHTIRVNSYATRQFARDGDIGDSPGNNGCLGIQGLYDFLNSDQVQVEEWDQ